MTTTDGRRQRTEKSRERILDAVIELVEETGDIPTAQQIADRAEMSIRTVFRLYDDIGDVQASAIQRRMQSLRERFVGPNPKGRLEDRIDEMCATWSRLHEEVTPLRRVIVGVLDRSELLAQQYDAGMRYLRSVIEEAFSPELDAYDAPERARRLAALDASLSWELWHRLRTTQGLDPVAAQAVVVDFVTRTLRP